VCNWVVSKAELLLGLSSAKMEILCILGHVNRHTHTIGSASVDRPIGSICKHSLQYNAYSYSYALTRQLPR